MTKTPSMQPKLTIGRLAKAAGINIESVRYYQRIGLIAEPPKPQHGFRHYPAKTIERIKFIKRAQQLGFSLQEIADLIALGSGHCRDVRQRAEKKRDTIEMRIRDLQALRETLDKLINACLAGNDEHHCPMVESLLAQDTPSAN